MASESNGTDGFSPAPDVEVRPAREQRRSRRLPVVLGIVTTVVVAGLAVSATRRAPRTDEVPSSLSTSVPVRFDPGQQLLRLSYLPGPVRVATYTTAPKVHRLQISGSLDGASTTEEEKTFSGKYAWDAEILMAARGVDVYRSSFEDEDSGRRGIPRERVKPVHGRPAFQAKSDHDRVLVWEYAPDAWMRIRLGTVSTAERRDEMTRQMAEGVRWEATPRPLPFQVVGLPDGAVLEHTYLRWDTDGPMTASANYLVAPVKNSQEEPRPVITVGVSTESLFRTRHNDDVTVAGRSATASESRGTGTLGVYRVAQLPGGCAECVAELRVARSATAAVGDRDDALKLAASIRLVKGHEDPARWRPW